MMNSRNQISEMLQKHGIRPSEQRIVIYHYLLDHRIHPVAETIYQELVSMHPTLSRTTVYNTLKCFEKNGLVIPLTIEDGELRYDVNTSLHAHFKCRKCNLIHDIFVDDLKSSLPHPAAGYQVESMHLDYYGICPECAGKK